VQRLRNLITVSRFARPPPLLHAGAAGRKANANKNEINWTTKKKKGKSMRPLTLLGRGGWGYFIFYFFFHWSSVGADPGCSLIIQMLPQVGTILSFVGWFGW